MKLKEVLDKTIKFFKDKGIESARLDAELLFADVLKLERIQLYVRFEQPLSEEELSKLREVVKRRTSGESVAHILGNKDFFGLNFDVSADTLIPRPETETLVEKVLDWTKLNPSAEIKILDLGSGTGCIGITLGKLVPNAKVLCVEKSAGAFEILQRNIQKNAVGENVQAVNLDLDQVEVCRAKFKELGFEQVQVIASNPPYIAETDPEVHPDVRKHEPHMALFSAKEGLASLESWSQAYAPLLAPNSMLIFEMGYQQGPKMLQHFQSISEFKSCKVLRDLAGHERFVQAVNSLAAESQKESSNSQTGVNLG